MKLKKSVEGLSKAIGLESIINAIMTIVLVAGIIIGVFTLKNNYTWEDIVKDSHGTYEYSAYDKKHFNGVSEQAQKLYKNARILSGYSDVNNLSLESYSSGSTIIYGWDESDSEKLNSCMDDVLEEITSMEKETSFDKKDRIVITKSLKMIRYFCNNQQVIDKVRMEMKLTSKASKIDSKLNIYLINGGGPEYFEGYSDRLNSLKNIFQ